MSKSIFLVSSEAVPFYKTGGLADVVSALSREFAELGLSVKLFIPLYDDSMIEKLKLKKLDITLNIFEDIFYYEHLIQKNNKVIFVKSNSITKGGLYGENGKTYTDNCKRFSIFSRSIIEYIKLTNDYPTLIQCNDWQTALIPALLKKYDLDSKIKSVLTIHNLAYQGNFPIRLIHQTDLTEEYFELPKKNISEINFLKSGIINADKITTVSPAYAEEILTDNFACGLKEYLLLRKDCLFGILNGIDTDVWNSKTDPYIKKNFTKDTLNVKEDLKNILKSELGFKNSQRPLLSIISRLAEQKGINLLYGSDYPLIEKILNELDVDIIIVGTGEKWAEEKLLSLAKKYDNLKVFITFDEALSHSIEASSDFFLMPSYYEPCGLNQMYSLVYATIPIVSKTGGLKNSVVNYDEENGDGIFIESLSYDAIFDAVKIALDIKKNDVALFNKLRQNAIANDFSWKKSAKKYLQLFNEIK